MTINDFLKEMQELFGKVEYKATSKDGQTFKSKGFEDASDAKKRQSPKSDIADW
jgi:hypothetical protein|tara:strand:+ start:601 stop:762 length:162 start_codon:yes stop_codon:yes gene_type:complete